jgi:hypothetical protein
MSAMYRRPLAAASGARRSIGKRAETRQSIFLAVMALTMPALRLSKVRSGFLGRPRNDGTGRPRNDRPSFFATGITSHLAAIARAANFGQPPAKAGV